jgi:ketosteroid isomerase-like protein
MSRENLDVVRAMYDAFHRGDSDTILELADPAVSIEDHGVIVSTRRAQSSKSCSRRATKSSRSSACEARGRSVVFRSKGTSATSGGSRAEWFAASA